MQTVIEYNGVTIRDVLTDNITVEPAKDSTRVDQIGVRVVVACTGVLYANHTGKASASRGAFVDGAATMGIAVGLPDMLYKLTKDRRYFRMSIGSVNLFDVMPGAVEPGSGAPTSSAMNNMDIDHGPKPKVDVLSIKAGYSATIRFTIEFTVANCDGSVYEHGGLINFRFWVYEDVDCKTWLTTRTYSGKLRVAHKHISPQVLARWVVIPPLQRGFQRKVIGLHESEDGLHLDFTVRDEEIIAAPPWDSSRGVGATDWSGTFRLSTSWPCTHTYSEISFRLTGPKGTHKTDLIDIALKVIEAKTHALSIFGGEGPAAGGDGTGQSFLEQFAVGEVLEANTIEAACKIRHNANAYQMFALFALNPHDLSKQVIGEPLPDMGIGYDPQVAFYPGTSATLTGLFLSILQSPCKPNKMPTVTDAPPYREEPKREESTPPETPYPSPGSYEGQQASESHLNAMYLDYSIDSDLFVNTGLAAFPTGASTGPNTISVVSMHRSMAMREIRIEASRVGQAPELPEIATSFVDSNGINHTMIGECVVSADAPQVSADARKLLYSAYWHARYALNRAPTASEQIAVGAVPYRVSNLSDPSRRLPSTIFVKPQKLLA